MGGDDQNEDSILEDMTISFNHTDMTPIATPYQEANGSTTRLESQIELDEELNLSPVKFFYSHNDPGQYSIGHTPDLLEENNTPTQRALSSSLKEEDSKLSVIKEGISDKQNDDFMASYVKVLQERRVKWDSLMKSELKDGSKLHLL